jgi:Fe-S cluster biogenesis protein NfuA
VEVHGNSARVRLTGMCAGCPFAHLTIHTGLGGALREQIEDFGELHVL